MIDTVTSQTLCNRRSSARAGFSLVEVAMALAIMGFGCVSLIGLLPMGLHSFREAMGNTVEAQIVQNMTNDIVLAGPSSLTQYNNQVYYFDNEGTQLISTSGAPGGTFYTATVAVNALNTQTSSVVVTASIVKISLSSISNPGASQAHVYPVIVSNN